MPLPNDATLVWPPKEMAAALASYRAWAAWWSGSLDDLATVYAQTVGFDSGAAIDGRDRTALIALRPRMFHGTPAARGALKNTKLHIPLAADIATTSADLLFGEPPVLVATDDDDKAGPANGKESPAQHRLDDYLANGLQAVLLESAEIAAAFGGVYLRVGWDPEIGETPLFDAIAPDAAVPEFRSGQLRAVTFHRVLRDLDDGKVWRHLERHEPGRILHGLYASGDDKTLGAKQPLQAHPETAAFAVLVNGGDYVETGATGLTAEYVPNMRPNRRLRGSQLGRSDLDGIESLMDALDEAWTSWMRDLRIGKGRLIVPEAYLDTQGRGRGAVFDAEQEVYQTLNALPSAKDGGLALSSVQFNIRVAEHQQTCASLIEQTVRGAGYSAQTFGMQGDGAAATATEVNARQSRSFMTRGKKINYYRPALARLARTALQIDVAKFKAKGFTPGLPDVEFPDGIAVDPQTQAQTLQLLRGAQAASTKTLVEALHPDWNGDRVAEEVAAIEKEGQPPTAGEPPAFPGSTVTGHPAGTPAGQPPVEPPPAAVPAAPAKPAAAPPRPAPRPAPPLRRPSAAVRR